MFKKRDDYYEQIKELLLHKIGKELILFEINDIDNIVFGYIRKMFNHRLFIINI